MKPLFTIHAGEFTVGDFIERKFRRVKVWVPAKDTGIDLLVTDKNIKRTISLQVKFSRDYLATHLGPKYRKALRACGWFSVNRHKIVKSPADYWVFVLIGFGNQSFDYIIIKRAELLRRLNSIHEKQNRINIYFWVTKKLNKKKKMCWETRKLKALDKILITEGNFKSMKHNFSKHLDDWDMIKRLNK